MGNKSGPTKTMDDTMEFAEPNPSAVAPAARGRTTKAVVAAGAVASALAATAAYRRHRARRDQVARLHVQPTT